MSFTIKAFSGKQAVDYIEEIAALRIEVFREFPYLYDGSFDYEREYLARYFNAPDAKIFLVFDGNKSIGVTTCIPLWHEIPEIQKPFTEKGLNVKEYFYFGESILQKEYRGKGIGKRFFQYREDEAKKHPDVKFTTFCAVLRRNEHALKPLQYKPLDGFWTKSGYIFQPELYTFLSWKDVDQLNETPKKLGFWIKKL